MIFRLFKTQVLLCLIIMSLSLVILEKCLPFKTGILSDFTVVRCGEQNEQGGSCPQQPGMRFKLVGNDKKNASIISQQKEERMDRSDDVHI